MERIIETEHGVDYGPRVIYRPSVLSEECPYTVNVNATACAELLKENGLSEDKIKRLKINVRRRSRSATIAGRTSPFGNQIGINCDLYWNWYEYYHGEVLNLIYERVFEDYDINEEQDFSKLLYTKSKKLPKYLDSAPPKRGREFADKLLVNGLNRRTNETLIHELKHVIDLNISKKPYIQSIGVKTGILSAGVAVSIAVASRFLGDPDSLSELIAYEGSAAVGLLVSSYIPLQVWYRADPVERSARKFASEKNSDVAWKRLVTITPKSKVD